MSPPFVIAAFYQFVALENHQALRKPLHTFMLDQNITGTLLLAHEGVNGTVAGSRLAIDRLLHYLKTNPLWQGKLANLKHKESVTEKQPFAKTKVRLKKEIVTMGIENIDPNTVVGTYVKPKDWNALIDDPDVLLVDTRNDYEVEIGTFRKANSQPALDPKTDDFRHFPNFVKQNLNPKTHKKVAMYCTGGIRCEKATAYLKQQGFEEVYHLEGGILKYLEQIPPEESRWEGECYVFDGRVSVDHHLNRGSYHMCFACGYPVTTEDQTHEHYQEGISCPRCHGTYTDAQLAAFAMRQKQINLTRKTAP